LERGVSVTSPDSLIKAIMGGAEAAQALRDLAKRIRSCCSHPMVRRASDEELGEITQRFLVHLLESQAKGWICTVETNTFLGKAVAQLLDKPSTKAIEDHPRPYYDHLRQKTKDLLRKDPLFRVIGEPNRRGKHYALAAPGTSVSERILDRHELGAMLPTVPSDLRQVRGDQICEVVNTEDLRRQLEQIFVLGGNHPRTLDCLVGLVFDSLSPRPQLEVRLVPTEALVGSGNELSDALESPHSRIDAGRVAVLAQEFVEGLPDRTRRAACLRYCGEKPATLTEIARVLGVAVGTAENEVGETNGRFTREIREFARSRDLDEGNKVDLRDMVLEILRADHF